MPTHGVPIVSVLIQNETQSKVFRIGDTMTDVTEDMPGSQPFTGVLRGIQLSARENKLNRGDKVYDNIPTVGYWNAGCGMADVTAEDYDIELLLLENAEGEVRIIHADMLKYLELYDEDQEAWISATKEEITTYINSISNDGITSIVVDDANNTVTVAIDTTNDLDIGLVPFLTGVDGLKSVVYTAGNQSYTLIIGDESTYTTFQKGVLNTMPNTNGSSTNGNLNLTAENGASLVYTLKVTYFNQDEEFQKIDTYLTGYQHTDVTVANTGDKAYTVVGHVVDAEGLNFDPLSAVAEVQNLTKVKITAGEQSQETSEIPAGIEGLKTFLNSVIPYDNTADPVTVAIELTAGNAIVTYTLVYSSDVIADPEAIVNGRRYATLAEALAGAQSGETIELQKDLLLGNGTATGAANNPVIALPANVSFDGGSHIITANEMSWSGTNMNHLIGVTSGTAAIKNVTLVGHSKMKSGIVCYGNGTNVTLQNITAQNCGNCGVQVAGATVSATNLTTSGNAWGGVNVDKGSDGSVPHFTVGEGCVFAEKAEVYTEITDQDVVTAPAMTKVQGFGTTLKGFIYYTTDATKLECVATIGTDKYCETVADAIVNAVSGDEIKLLKNITVDNAAVSSSVNTPVIVVPDGVTFNGGNFAITADPDNWVGEGANHVLGIVGTTGTIKDVTIEGNGKDKAGVIVFGLNSNGTLENVTSKNNGQLGVLIGGATAVATNVNTEGNPWGGINVDKGSDGSVPNFTFNSGTLAENVEIYTEITDQDVITASGFEKFQGFGINLKGFMYYTSDVATKFAGAIVIDDKIYETIADAIENNDTVTVTVPASKAESFSIPEGKTVTLDMGGNTLSNVDGSDTIVNNGTLIINGEGTIDNTSNDKAAITNNGTLTILKGTITRSTDAGTADGDGGNSYYTILNHGTMTIGAEEGNDADVVISNNGAFSSLISNGWYDSEGKTPEADSCYMTINCGTFTGGKYCFKNDELGNATINGGVYSGAANVSVLNWHNMTINNGVFTAAAAKANVANGTYGQGVGHLVITGGEFNATNVPNLTMINGYASSDIAVSGGVFTSKTGLSNYLVDGYRIDSEINPGKFTVVKVTPEEQLDEIMANIPGANEESDNVFAFTTTDGTISLDFLDQIAAINGFSDMKVSDGQTEYTFTNDGVMDTFKEQIQTLLPTSNEDPQVTLTLTVNFAV